MPTPTEWLNELQVNTGAEENDLQFAPDIIGPSNGNFLVTWREVDFWLSPLKKALLTAIGVVTFGIGYTLSADAATFNIVYDDTLGRGLDGNIVGTGTLSFDGPALLGESSLDSLTNLQFSANIFGAIFDDIQTDLAQTSLLVFEDSGQTLATFAGTGGLLQGGSFDAQNMTDFVSHEPGPVGVPCCGGTDVSRLYGLQSLDGPIGNYQIELVSTPEPTSIIGLLAVSIVGTGTVLKSRKAT